MGTGPREPWGGTPGPRARRLGVLPGKNWVGRDAWKGRPGGGGPSEQTRDGRCSACSGAHGVQPGESEGQ